MRQTCQAGGTPDVTDVRLGAVSILTALIRLLRLTAVPRESPAQSLDSLEELTEPVI